MLDPPDTSDAIHVLKLLRPHSEPVEVQRACQLSSRFVTDNKFLLNRATYTPLCGLLLQKIAPLLSPSHTSTSAVLSPAQCQLITPLFDTCFLRGIPAVAFRQLTSVLAKQLPSEPSTESRSDPRAVVARTLVLFVARSTGGAQRLAQVISNVDDDDIGSGNNNDVVNTLVHLPSRLLNVLFSKSDATSDDNDYAGSDDGIDSNDYSNNNTKLYTNNAATSGLPISESEYVHTLCEALYLQPTTSDVVREGVVRALLSRIITLGYAPALISTLVNHNDVTKAQALLKLATSSRVHALLRGLLEAPVQDSRGEWFVRSILTYLIAHDRAARDACIYRIPFTRPLFRSPRMSLIRLVSTMCNITTLDGTNKPDAIHIDALTTAAENWSDESFALGADVAMQRQVTRLLLYYLCQTAPSANHVRDSKTVARPSVTVDIARGVQIRLDESDIRLRRHAMVIAEAASRHAGDPKPLKFDRTGLSETRRNVQKTIGDNAKDDDGDSDFSDIALSVGQPGSEIELEGDRSCMPTTAEQERACEVISEAVQVTDLTFSGDTVRTEGQNGADDSSRRHNRVVQHDWPVRNDFDDWQGEDDWSSSDSYEQTSSEDADQNAALYADEEALRKKLHAPDSVGRLLIFIREMNSAEGGAVTIPPETALAALRSIKLRADARRGTDALRIAALDLCLDLSIFEPERYPDNAVDALKLARESALTSVLRLDIGPTGCGLVSRVVCGPSADIGRRLETLTILTNAVRQEAEFVNSQDGNVVRGLRRGTQLLAEQFAHIFHTLVSALCAENAGNADFINVEGRDSELWARALVTLAALARGAGATLEGSAMRKELLSVTLDRVIPSVRADVVVRRAMALVLGSAVDNMTENELSQAFQGSSSNAVIYLREADIDDKDLSRLADRALEWLVAAAQDDADVGVRRFAALGMHKWAAHANLD